MLDNAPEVEEEEYKQDVLTIEGPLVKAPEAEVVEEPAEQKKEQHEFHYAENQTGKDANSPTFTIRERMDLPSRMDRNPNPEDNMPLFLS